jgi:hypothetical protein
MPEGPVIGDESSEAAATIGVGHSVARSAST